MRFIEQLEVSDEKEALRLYKIAAELGHPFALLKLGDESKLQNNQDKANEYYKKAYLADPNNEYLISKLNNKVDIDSLFSPQEKDKLLNQMKTDLSEENNNMILLNNVLTLLLIEQKQYYRNVNIIKKIAVYFFTLSILSLIAGLFILVL